MPNLYIIAGCNGAGKTTASFTILPEILDCKEFVNAGLKNFFGLYKDIVDNWMICDNSDAIPIIVATGSVDLSFSVFNHDLWNKINQCHDYRRIYKIE